MYMFEENQEKFLLEIRNSGTLLLVEGKRDRKVLENAGLENIIEISGKQLEKVADIVNGRDSKVTILTDYDKEGIKQYKRLKNLLLTNGIKIDDKLRRDFKRIFLVDKIEELISYFK